MDTLSKNNYDRFYTDYWLTLLYCGNPVTYLVSKEECNIRALLNIKSQHTHEDFSIAMSKTEMTKSCREATIAARRNSSGSTSLTANGDTSSATSEVKKHRNPI